MLRSGICAAILADSACLSFALVSGGSPVLFSVPGCKAPSDPGVPYCPTFVQDAFA